MVFGVGIDAVYLMIITAIPFFIIALIHGRMINEQYRSGAMTWNPYAFNYFRINKRKKNIDAELNEEWDATLTEKQYAAFGLFKTNKKAIAFVQQADDYRFNNWNRFIQWPSFMHILNVIVNTIGISFILLPMLTAVIAGGLHIIKIEAQTGLTAKQFLMVLWVLLLVWRSILLIKAIKANPSRERDEADAEIMDSWVRRGVIMDEITIKHFNSDLAMVIDYANSENAIVNQYKAYTRYHKREAANWLDYDHDFKQFMLVRDKNYDRDAMGIWLGIGAALLVGTVLLVQLVMLIKLILAVIIPIGEAADAIGF